MAKYDVTFSCGHTVTISLYGKESDRQRKIKWYEENGLCPDCYKKQIEESRKAAAEEAADEAKALGLAELQGSEKQISWANSIRTAQIEAISKDMEVLQKDIDRISKTGKNIEQLDTAKKLMVFLDAIEQVIGSETSAAKIIDNRRMNYQWASEKFAKDYDKLESGVETPEDYRDYGSFAVDTVKVIEGDDAQLAEKEYIVLMPEDKKSDVAASVEYTDKEVSVVSAKDQKIIDLVKGLGYRWNRTAWVLPIDIASGKPEDRAAEVANKLLLAGYQVSVPSAIKDAAASGKYEPRCTRWITKYNDDDDNVYLSWDREDDLYRQASGLVGAKWISRRGMRVPASSADEIEDFAQVYGFQISPGAQESIAEYRKKVTIVTPEAGASEEKKDGEENIKGILNSSREVIEDLRDND